MHEEPRKPTENHILAALPPEDYGRLRAQLEHIKLSHRQILYHVDQPIDYLYFPTNAMVSLVSEMSDGTSVEVGIIGFEGMAGLSTLLGVDPSPHEMMAQIPGGALRVRTEIIKEEFKRGGPLQGLLLRYTHSRLLLASQVAACNRSHTVGKRLARWLLMSYDRCVCAELPLTQEFIAMMLGTRRAGVTEAASILQTKGLINYGRRRITIVDKPGLEAFACECYGIIKADFMQLIS